MTTAAWILAQTTMIKVGTAIVLIPGRNREHLEPVAHLERLAACIPIRQAKLSLQVQTRSISGKLDPTQRPD